MGIELKRRRFTVDEYRRMGEVGILDEDERVELIEGEIVEMSPIGRRHAGIVNRLNDLFTFRLRGRAIVAVQNPISLGSKYSEPQPDLTLLRPRADFYADSRPEPPDVLLVVEVMDTSVERDRQVKLPLYARAGVPEQSSASRRACGA
jgi:Uma2 family endonuclease